MCEGKARYTIRRLSANSALQEHTPLSIAGCFNCDDPRHMLRDFSLSRNIGKSTVKKLEYFNKRIFYNCSHMVLAAVFHHLDCSLAKVHETDDDAEILSALIAGVAH